MISLNLAMLPILKNTKIEKKFQGFRKLKTSQLSVGEELLKRILISKLLIKV